MKILYRFIDVVILLIFELRINEYYQFISLNEFKYTCMVCEKVDFVLLCTTLSVLYIYSTILLFFKTHLHFQKLLGWYFPQHCIMRSSHVGLPLCILLISCFELLTGKHAIILQHLFSCTTLGRVQSTLRSWKWAGRHITGASIYCTSYRCKQLDLYTATWMPQLIHCS